MLDSAFGRVGNTSSLRAVRSSLGQCFRLTIHYELRACCLVLKDRVKLTRLFENEGRCRVRRRFSPSGPIAQLARARA